MTDPRRFSEGALLTGNGNEMLAVVEETEPGNEFGMTRHGGHAFARDVVEDGDGLVRAGGRGVQAAAIQNDLDQGSVIAERTLERFGMLAVADRVHANVAILTSR